MSVKGIWGEKNFIDFFSDFWDYDNSPYIKDKLAHGHSITRGYTHIWDGYSAGL